MGSQPTAVARVTPTGNLLERGYQCLITITADTNIDLFEISVQPPGYDNGDPINITTQHNANVETKAANPLYEVTDGQCLCAYARPVYSQIASVIGVNGTLTYLFQDGGTVAVYGYLKSFIPNQPGRRDFPQATCVFVHTNIDPSDGTEQLPTISAAVGTP